MILTGAMVWWNERPDDLYACVRAAGQVVDRFVAIDGAYSRYPGATPRSSDAECDAIRQAASDAGVGCRILQPDTLWAGQVEKRSHLFAAASVGSDWVAVFDADHVLTAVDAFAVRRFLERTGADALTVPYFTPPDPSRLPADRSPGMWHEEVSGQTFDITHIFRALPGLRVERRHWWVSGIARNGLRHWLWGGDGSYPTLTPTAMPAPYRVEHRCLHRSREQVLASRGFLNDRETVVAQTGQEDDRPDLPRPVFDYERMPA